MESSETILVIILASALAVFLVLAIIAAVKIIQILDQIKRICEKAENLAEKAEAVGDFFQKSAGPIAIGRFVANMAETVFQKKQYKNSKSKGEEDA